MLKRYLIISLLLPFAAGAQIRINTGASVVVNGAANLVINNGALVNNGNFDGTNSTVWFTGNADTGAVQMKGSGTTLFNNVVINKTAGDVMMYQDVAVAGTITMQKGNLWLNNHVLHLDSTGSIAGESNQSQIESVGSGTGSVVVTRTFNGQPYKVNPGNIGFEFTTAVNPKWVQIVRNNSVQITPNGAFSIARNFTVTAGNNRGLYGTIRFYYLDNELGINNEAGLNLYTADSSSSWQLAVKDSSNTVADWFLAAGIDHFNRYTLFASNAAQARIKTTPTAVAASQAADIGGSNKPSQVYPNPTYGQCTVVLYSNQAVAGSISLYDEMGHLLQTQKINYLPGINQLTLNMQGYANGVYYLVSDNKAIRNRIRIIKE